MNKTMKKLLSFSLLILGVLVFSRSTASANDYESSTWTARYFFAISTLTLPGVDQASQGVTPSKGSVDVTRVFVSSGLANGAYFVCVDTFPLTATNGSALTFAGMTFENYIFPPLQFMPSTATLLGQPFGGQVLDLRDYQGGGRTIKNGIVCFVQGDTTNRYFWTVETAETPSASERR